ncbi:MAG TPA: hypothetical protein ENJ13_04375 [Chromatiales bacterium]|nr:hypothetical protein [Chromatiales bacterium]
MALFDLPYQWIFPVIFIAMTAIIAICFMKYVILAEDKDDDEGEEQASASIQVSEKSVSEKSEEKKLK